MSDEYKLAIVVFVVIWAWERLRPGPSALPASFNWLELLTRPPVGARPGQMYSDCNVNQTPTFQVGNPRRDFQSGKVYVDVQATLGQQHVVMEVPLVKRGDAIEAGSYYWYHNPQNGLTVSPSDVSQRVNRFVTNNRERIEALMGESSKFGA